MLFGSAQSIVRWEYSDAPLQVMVVVQYVLTIITIWQFRQSIMRLGSRLRRY
jgi:hypothetical protein